MAELLEQGVDQLDDRVKPAKAADPVAHVARPASDAPATTPAGATQPPVIVYGALRSGTTLLRLVVDGNRALSCPDETDYLFDFIDEHGQMDLGAMARDRIFGASGLDLPSTAQADVALAQLLAQLHAQKAGRLMLMIHRNLDRALAMLPDSPILHVLRDPRDVARSSIGMGWAGNEYHGVTHWMQTEGEWDAAAPALAGRVVQTLRYEDFVEQPRDQIAALCDFLGVDYVDDMLHIDRRSTYQPIDGRLAWQWQRKQTPRQLALVESRLGGMLAARGYAASGHAPAAPGVMGRLALKLHSKWGVQRHRMARYGAGDALVDTVVKRLRLPATWAEQTRARMRQADIAALK